ncbi:hypothetical protein T02_16212 [Trichinella nativa]|uniref:Uncharacterized protein n=1 Tax=Trichinella nativa TaxID=6335 RepID=A0A0V1KZB4_9BILA|nr:hypothetical protein T02_16212 [Trichinella nativa]
MKIQAPTNGRNQVPNRSRHRNHHREQVTPGLARPNL